MKLNKINPRSLGQLHSTDIIEKELLDLIAQKIPLSPSDSSYPAYFSEFVEPHCKRYKAHKTLVLPPSTKLDGDLELDWQAPWAAEERLAGIFCPGDLTIDGDIFNKSLNQGPLLFVAGNLKVTNLIKGGAPIIVLGDLISTGLVICEYNDGILRVGGNLRARALLSFDHDYYVRGEVEGHAFSSDDDIWREILDDNAFENERADDPNTELIWAQTRAGKNILRVSED